MFCIVWDQGVEIRVGCVGSFLAALTHVACTSSDPGVLSAALTHTLPWCTAQHFNTRLYAQVRLGRDGPALVEWGEMGRVVECS